MLAVYDNGQGTEPRLTNLRYKRSNAGGVWSGIVVGSQTGGDGNVFSTNATINQTTGIWCPSPRAASMPSAGRRTGRRRRGRLQRGQNTWSPMAAAPPVFAAGQSAKAGAGLFGATDGSSVWVCVINTDVANSILCASSTQPRGPRGSSCPAPRSAARIATTFPARRRWATTRSA